MKHYPYILVLFITTLLTTPAFGQTAGTGNTTPCVIEAKAYPGTDPVMWDGLYAASNGRVYTGLITEGGSAHFYEYDPAQGANRLLFDMAEFFGERGKGIRTSCKLHNKPVEDADGKLYFTTMNNGGGPRNFDFGSWSGGHWLQYDPSTGVLTNLGLVDKGTGIYPLVIDRTRNRLIGVGFTGYLYRFDIAKRRTTNLGRVCNWDITRKTFCDDQGNVYGGFPPGRVWKYDAEDEKVYDLSIRLPHDPTIFPTQLQNPMLDRSDDWRAVEWDPVEKVAYGITCGTGSTLFRFDPHQGSEGAVTVLDQLCDPQFYGTGRKDIPYSTLAFALDSKSRKVYFVPSSRGYSIGRYAETFGNKNRVHLIMYDLAQQRRVDLGVLETSDGRRVFGCEAASFGPDGTLYICGQVEVANKTEATAFIDDIPVALALIIYRP